MEAISNEEFLGFVTRYSIGMALAIPYIVSWELLVGGPVSPAWAPVYDGATTVASRFFVFPSMGLGVFGIRAPEGLKAPISSLANHLFYGLGIAAGITLV